MHLLLAAALLIANAQRAHIDGVVREVMRARHVAGLSLGIAREGRLLYLRGYGLRDANERLAADGYTIYSAGSIAKQFTAALVMQQVAAGRIALDAPVGRYLAMPDEGLGRVTIAQLLGQTGGIVRASDGATLAFVPGTAWQYDNLNYDLLGTVLQTVTGAAYPVLLRDRIAARFSLSSTACGPSPFAENVARGYAWRAGRLERPAPVVSDAGCAAAGLVSNAADLLHWLEALRAGGIVSTASMAAMTTSGKLAGGIPTHYGFGFFITDWFGYAVAEHPGYVAGFSSDDALVLGNGLEIAVLTNADTVDVTPLTQSIVAILDAPLDANLSASAARPAQNENLRVTSELRAMVQSPRYATFGPLQLVEFVERSAGGGTTSDRYRLTFSRGQWWATVRYREDGVIASLSLMPVE